MSIGETLNRNPAIGIGIAVVVLIIAAVIFMRSTGVGESAQVIEQRYFYDLTTGELVALPNEPAPVTTASGSSAVWANVYACGSCDNESDRFIAYLEKYTDAAKSEASKPLARQDYDTLSNGHLLGMAPREPGGDIQWVPIETAEGMQITQTSLEGRCTGAALPMPCQP
jgi:hypothetical protein